jgi:capsular exopolysaccharide synthesis family protein
MPEEGRSSEPLSLPPASGSKSLQVRRDTDLSTLLFPPEVASGAADDEVHFRDLWHVVVKRKWSIVAFFVIVVVATAIGTLMQTPIYRAEITLRIDSEASKIIPFKDGVQFDTGDPDYFQTQLELLKSRALAERVVAQMKLKPAVATAPQPRPWWEEVFRKESAQQAPPSAEEANKAAARNAADSFRGGLSVIPIKNTKMVRVSYASSDPKLAADVLNSLAQNFINFNLEQRFDQSSYAKAFLEEKLAETKAKLETNERGLIEFQRENAIVTVDDRQTVLSSTLADYSAAANRAEQDLAKAEALYELIKTNPESAPQVLESKTVQVLKEQRAKLQGEYADSLRIFKPGYPKMQQLQAQIDELDKGIKGEIDAVSKSVETAYQSLLAQQKSIQAKLEQTKKDVLDLQARSIRYNILKRDVDTDRAIYNSLLQRLNEVGVTGGTGANNIAVVDRAEVPSGPYKPDLRQNLIIAILLGLIGGVALAFFLEHLDDSIRTPEDMEKLTQLAVLGVVPKIPQPRTGEGKSLALMAHEDVRSTFSEAYRSVRTALQFSTREGAPKVFMVTSTAKGDGKTTTALALAINSAQTGRPVLLIDADMRHPALHRALAIDNSRGLSNYLSSDVPALGVVRTTQIPNLFVIPAGPMPPNPVELLSGPKLLSLLGQLGDRFIHIIVDSPPVLGLADSIVLGDQVGAVLFVIASATTRKAHARAALKRLRQANVHPLGAIMTKLDLRDGMYGYESAYYYYRSTNDVPRLT